MPVLRFEVGNEYGLADPQLYEGADKDDPEALLEGVAMAGLVGVLRQLGDLAEFAAGIFHNLHEDVLATSSRGHSLMLRVQQLEAEFPPMERTFLLEINHTQSFHNTGTEWHPNIQIEQNLITGGDMPRFILDSYEECHALPRLFALDKFDLAGAGACLKRYSDPSFFKIEMVPSGTMQSGIQRERKSRKTKKKIPRLKNGESLEPPPDPHTTILNHMQSETTPSNSRIKRVKLKARPLNDMDSTKKSYMECVLERYIPKDDVLRENGITYSSTRTKSVDSTATHLESHVTAVDISLDNSLLSKPVLESPAIQEVHEARKEEPAQGTAKSFAIDEVEIPSQGVRPSEKTEGNFDESAISFEPVNGVSNKLKEEKISTNDSENRIDSGSDIYVSDDVASVVENIASDIDNFVDALGTMDSEVETDGDSRPKTQFRPSNVESEMLNETKEEKETTSEKKISTDLSGIENVINKDEQESSHLQKNNSPGEFSDSCLLKRDEIPNPMQEVSEACSTVASKDALDASNNEQSFQVDKPHFQVDEPHFQVHENSMASPEVSEVCSTVASKDALDASTDVQSFQVDEPHFQVHENSMASPDVSEACSTVASKDALNASTDVQSFQVDEPHFQVDGPHFQVYENSMASPEVSEACSTVASKDALNASTDMQSFQVDEPHFQVHENFKASPKVLEACSTVASKDALDASTDVQSFQMDEPHFQVDEPHFQVHENFMASLEVLEACSSVASKDALDASAVASKDALDASTDVQSFQVDEPHFQVNELHFQVHENSMASPEVLEACSTVASKDALNASTDVQSLQVDEPHFQVDDPHFQEASSSGEKKSLISENKAGFDEERALISKQETCSGCENALIFEQEAGSAGEKVTISEEETCSGREKALIFEQDSRSVVEKASISRQKDEMKIGVSESESNNAIGSDKFLELSCYLEEPKGPSPSSSVICLSSSPESDSQESGGDQPAIAAKNTSSINSVNKLFEQSIFMPAENYSRTDFSSVSNELFSDNVNDADVAVKQQHGDFKCSRDNFNLPARLEESTVNDDALNMDVSQACHTQLVRSENLTSITSLKDTKEEHCLDHVEGTSPFERVCTSGNFDASPSGKDLQSSAVREIEPCQLERKKSDSDPGGTETATVDDEDLECFRLKSVGITSSPTDNIQSSSSKEEDLLSHDRVSSKCLVAFPTKGAPSMSWDLFSDVLDDEGEFLVLDKDQLHLLSNYQMSQSPSHTLPNEDHPTAISFATKSADLQDGIDEQHHSPVDTASQSSKDSTPLHAALQKYGSEADESLGSLQEPKDMGSVGVLTLSCDETIHQEKMLTSSCSESSPKKIDSNFPDSVSADMNEVDELQCNGEHKSVEEFFPRNHEVSPHLHEEHDDVYPHELHEATENCFSGTEGGVVDADQKKCNLQSSIAIRDPTELDHADIEDSLDKGQVKMADSQIDVACSAIADSLDNYCVDTPNNISLDNQHKQIRDIDPSGEIDRGIMLFETDASLSSESPSKETVGDDASSSAKPSTTLTTQLHSDSIPCEVSILSAKEKSLESDSPTEMAIVGESSTANASHDLLHPQPVPSVLQNSVTDESNEIQEKDAAHSSKTSCTISLGESSTFPSESSCGPSATLVHTDSNQPPSVSLTQAHSEASVVAQPGYSLSAKNMENSPQAPSAPVSSLDFPITSPVYVDTSESSEKMLQSFPSAGPSTLQCDMNATSPLPPLPLPPLQWRMGKTKVSPQASTATISDPLSESNIFAPLSGVGYLQSYLEPSGMRKQSVGENQNAHYGSMTTREGYSLPLHGHTEIMQHSGSESYNPNSVKYREEDAHAKFTSQDAYDANVENSHRYPKAFQEAISYQKSFAPAVASSEINLQHSSTIGNEQMQVYNQLASLQIPGSEKQQSSIATLQSIQTDHQLSGPFVVAPPRIDPRYQYGYRFFGGENMQTFATQGIIPHHGFYMPVGENIYGPYPMPLLHRESEKPNGRPNSILNRPRDPLIEAVVSHDKSTLRKVSEIVQSSAKPKEDEKNILLDQIKEKTINLKPTAVMRPNVKGPTTNLKVAAILEKANAMRQACAGSDDEDTWSDC